MLKIEDMLWSDDQPGLPLVFVIDGQCVFDYAFNKSATELFLTYKTISDVSSEYPDHDGITLKIEKESGFEIFQTSEYLGSILLSDPMVVCLRDYPYGRYVVSPDATFDGEKFTITDRDMTELSPWREITENTPARMNSADFLTLHNITR